MLCSSKNIHHQKNKTMKRTSMVILAVMISMATFAQTWKSDSNHSKLGFSIKHLMISDVEGSFKTFSIIVTSAKEDFSDAVITLTADVNSINTDNDMRDGHLKSPSFFDAAKFPTLTFQSKSFTKVSDKNYKLTGDLTMHGVTKSVTLDVIYNGTITTGKDNNKVVAGFKVSGTVKRSDFGVGGAMTGTLGDDVTLNANAEIIKQ